MYYEPGILVPDITKLTEEEWLEERRKGIGGSDLAKIIGLSPFATRKELYWDKLKLPHDTYMEEDNWVAKEVGHRLEGLVIEIFQKKNPGWEVFYDRRMFYHPDYPWMLADCDALTKDPRTGQIYILEVKTCSENVLGKWGRKHENIIPPEYEAQGRHYMAVTGLDGVIFICLAGNNISNYRQRYIMRDMEKEHALIAAEADFWLNYVQKKIEPPYCGSDDAEMIIDALNAHYGSVPSCVDIPLSYADIVRELVNVNEAISQVSKREKELKKYKSRLLAPLLDFLKGREGVLALPDGMSIYVSPEERRSFSVKSDDLMGMWMEWPETKKYASETKSKFWKIKQNKREHCPLKEEKYVTQRNYGCGKKNPI